MRTAVVVGQRRGSGAEDPVPELGECPFGGNEKGTLLMAAAPTSVGCATQAGLPNFTSA